MNNTELIFFALPGNEVLTHSLAEKCRAEKGSFEFRHFPDGETYVKLNSEVNGKRAVLVCTLHNPDGQILLLYFLSQTIKDLGAAEICLVAPYLSYMRQDKRFRPGEAITSIYFAKLLSFFADSLITIDPHLHRTNSLSDIYYIPCTAIHVSKLISDWIKQNIDKPLLVGPDIESSQWVEEVAKNADAEFIILEKIRRGDTNVEESAPEVEKNKNLTPVLVDDIISTARTMIETTVRLKEAGIKRPVCIGIHGIFSGTAYNDLINAGVRDIITTNTIPHATNRIQVDDLIAAEILKQNVSKTL